MAELNHKESYELAVIKQEESNLARCYIGSQERIKELEAENEALQSAFVDGYELAKNEFSTQYAECRKAALLEAAEVCWNRRSIEGGYCADELSRMAEEQ